MRLAVVAYPTLDEADRAWIEAFRAKHDPQAPRIAAHFTLVFPFGAEVSTIEPEVGRVAAATKPISFAVRRADVVADRIAGGSHIFLVADDGGADIVALRDALYAGALRPHLRLDIPFVPHITVGWAASSLSASQLAGELHGCPCVLGTLATIDLVDVGPRLVTSVAARKLRGDARNIT